MTSHLKRLLDMWALYRLLRHGGNGMWWSAKHAHRMTDNPYCRYDARKKG